MADDPMIRTPIPLPKSMWDDIKAYQKQERIGSLAEAVRRVIQAGIKAIGRTADSR